MQAPAVFQRRARPPAPLPPAPPFPTPAQALLTFPPSLPTYFQSLALPSQYSLATPSTRKLLKLALYAFAVSPHSPYHSLLFSNGTPPPLSEITDDWSLSAAQGQGGGEYSESRRGKVCGHVFKAGESVYRCRDCSLDSTCVLCSKCFHGSSHTKDGHDVTMSIHAGLGAGCCDCGDAEAFKSGCHVNCKYHSLREGSGVAPETDDDVEQVKTLVGEILRVTIDFMISVLDDSPDEMIAPRSVEDIIASISSLERQRAQGYPAATTSASTSPAAASSDANLFNFTSPPSYSSSTSRGKARASSPTSRASPAGPWSVVLWNDEKHSFAQVIDQVTRATGVSRREAHAVAERVDTHGRDVIYISPDPSQLIFVSRLIAAIDLAVTVRSSMDTFFEQIVGELVEFLRDLCAVKVGGEGGVFTSVLAAVLMERRTPESYSRFQRLVNTDAKLWKAARKGLAEVYVTLLGDSLAVKTELSVHFAQIYSNIAESYLLTDREPENSIIFFGVQVFTVPSVSAYLVARHQFLANIISILYSFFTEQINHSDPKHLTLPPNPTVRRIDPESPAFKQKRYFQVFSDLNHLISSTPVKQLIRESTNHIEDFASFLDLFTSMNPNKRAVSTHVEYESDTWVTAFNVTIQLGKICRSFGEAFRHSTSLELARSLSALLQRMPGPRSAIHNVTFGGAVYQLIDFDVSTQLVSFHHPLAWLFAEMIKNVEVLDASQLQMIGVTSLSDLAQRRTGQLHFLSAMDHPLRVIVLVAQIRAGLWVRNGFGMRAQQLHYKEYSLRENTYDQDVFFLQAAFVILDPSIIFIAILDRFNVQAWLGGEDSHESFEPLQAFAMVEEMLYLLIVILSDTTYAAGTPADKCLRRELVHNLCLGPSTYSDLIRRVSEKFADDPALDRILAEVAHYKHPVGNSDQGTYTLRAACFSEVDPYFSRYSRNQREEADKLVREQLKKQGAKDPIIVPPPLDIPVGPFVTLTQAFNSDVLHQIIYFSLQHGRARGALFSEILVDEALHLSMLCLVEQPAVFASFASERILSVVEGESTLTHLLIKIEEDDRMKSVRHKARWCLDRLNELVGPAVNALRRVEDTASPAKALDAKRLAAKARQAAIMKQFAQAQQSFLASSQNVSEDEDDDDTMAGEEARTSLGSCIVCQDELDSSRPFGSLAFVQSSNFIRSTPQQAEYRAEILGMPSSLDRDASALRPFGVAAKKIPVSADDDLGDGLSQGFPLENDAGLHASACGHMMHLACFETYYKSLEQRHHHQPTRCHPESTERSEYICPLCKSLGNVLLPASVEAFRPRPTPDPAGTLEDWMSSALTPTSTVVAKRARSLQRRTIHGTAGLGAWVVDAEAFLDGAEIEEGTTYMISGLMKVVSSLLEELGKTPTDSFIPSTLFAYTVSAIEIASRGNGEAAGSLQEGTSRMLSSLLSVLADLVRLQEEDLLAHPDLALHALLPHLGGVFAAEIGSPPFASLEPLTTLIETAAILPSAFYHVVALAFYTELLQVLSGVFVLHEESEVVPFVAREDDEAAADYDALALVRHFFARPSAGGEILHDRSSRTLGKYLYSYTLPFLRRAAILHSALFGPPPIDDVAQGSEFSRLTTLLRIPHPAVALSQDAASPPRTGPAAAIQTHLTALRDRWLGPHSALLPYSAASPHPLQHPTFYELVGLPHQLDTLAAEGLQRKCARCKKVPADPALCLFCGEIVCHSSFCCMDGEQEAMHGECNIHMWSCGGAVAIYFLIKKNSLVYLYTDKGSFSTPPYLDSHGEVDLGGRRGRTQFPQYLHQGRYDEIRKTWLNHGIATFVARKLEATTDQGGWAMM